MAYAKRLGVKRVQVEQMCARPNYPSNMNGNRHKVMDYTHDDSHEMDYKIWAVKGETEFNGKEQHFVSRVRHGSHRTTEIEAFR